MMVIKSQSEFFLRQRLLESRLRLRRQGSGEHNTFVGLEALHDFLAPGLLDQQKDGGGIIAQPGADLFDEFIVDAVIFHLASDGTDGCAGSQPTDRSAEQQAC